MFDYLRHESSSWTGGRLRGQSRMKFKSLITKAGNRLKTKLLHYLSRYLSINTFIDPTLRTQLSSCCSFKFRKITLAPFRRAGLQKPQKKRKSLKDSRRITCKLDVPAPIRLVLNETRELNSKNFKEDGQSPAVIILLQTGRLQRYGEKSKRQSSQIGVLGLSAD